LGIEILAAIDPHSVAVGEILQTVRQLLGFDHAGAARPDWDDRDTFTQRGFDLDTHQISRVVKPALPTTPADPTRSDHNQHDAGVR
jgi:hypothetical protein